MVTMLHRIPLGPTLEAERPPWATATAPPQTTGATLRGVRYGGLLEVKDDAWRVEGLASTWELDGVGDQVEPGAFAESLGRNPRPPLLWAHDPAKVLGVAEALQETRDGLWGRWRLSKTELGRDVRQLLLDKAVDGLSIGFRCGPGDYEHTRGVRRLKRIQLYEVSLVAMPAANGARVTRVKSLPAEPGSYLAAFEARQRAREDWEYLGVRLKALRLKLSLMEAERKYERQQRAWKGY